MEDRYSTFIKWQKDTNNFSKNLQPNWKLLRVCVFFYLQFPKKYLIFFNAER